MGFEFDVLGVRFAWVGDEIQETEVILVLKPFTRRVVPKSEGVWKAFNQAVRSSPIVAATRYKISERPKTSTRGKISVSPLMVKFQIKNIFPAPLLFLFLPPAGLRNSLAPSLLH